MDEMLGPSHSPSEPRLHLSPQDMHPADQAQSEVLVSSSSSSRADRDFEDIELLDTRLKSEFENNLDLATTPLVLPKNVSVLMLYFHPKQADIDCEDEVMRLKQTFENLYNFKVSTKAIESQEGKLVSHVFNKHLSAFVCDEDGDDTLLIVYYAGHGWGGKEGKLTMRAKAKGSDENHILWLQTDSSLSSTRASVLVVLDCCDAGSITGRGLEQPYEYIGAVPANHTTSIPGPHSFTSALIWALEKMSSRTEGFTASELYNQIGKAPNRQPGHVPVHGDMRHRTQVKVALAPLPGSGNPFPPAFNYSQAEPRENPKAFFDVRFELTDVPSEQQWKKFSHGISRSMKDSGLASTNPTWRGLWAWEPVLQDKPLPRRLSTVGELFALRIALKQARRRQSMVPLTPSPGSMNEGNDCAAVPALPVPIPRRPVIEDAGYFPPLKPTAWMSTPPYINQNQTLFLGLGVVAGACLAKILKY